MNKIYGMFRGVVKLNSYNDEAGQPSDSTLKGRCKIWIPGIYPSEWENKPSKLPWAEPAYPIFGSNSTNGGINSVPAVGTVVWVFFEEGDYVYPVYFLSCQGGDGWSSEHVKQHTIKTENVSITLDDNPANDTKPVLKIDVTNEGDQALEINITGDVTINITGDVTQTVTGDVQETVTGNVTQTVTGNVATAATGTYNINGSSVIINGIPQVGS